MNIAWVALVGAPTFLQAGEDHRPFDEVQDTEPSPTDLTPAEQAVGKMTLPDGFEVTVFAAEPDVRQPIALTTDERGRLWIAENYTYAERSLNYDTKYRDRILIFEDTDGDGRFDKRKVFWDEGRKLTSIAVGFGGVWALCAPELLFIPDRDRDDVPDGEPRVVLDGWNDGFVRHNIVNGLRWGPDGWLYGRHGIQATSLVGKPGAPESKRVRLNCSIWRYHPTREAFEVVTHGTTNPWGFDYDDYGQMFFINTVIGHLWHVVPGAHYKRMYGADFNPHLYGLIDQCADHYHWDTGEKWNEVQDGISDSTSRKGGGHAHCGMMIYLGDNWPDRYRNTLFTVNLHGLRINNDRLHRQGAGYVGKHGEDFLFANDPWFRGIEMIYGPDGGVFLADWTDVGECHENDGVHRTSGRIYKITYDMSRSPERDIDGTEGLPNKDGDLRSAERRGREGHRPDRQSGWSAERAIDLAERSSRELVQLQLRKNDWYVRQSRRVLQERAATGTDLSGVHDELFRMYEEHPDVTRKLRAMWCLYVTGALDDAWLLEQLGHSSEHVRVWAVRLLVDDRDVSAETAARFAAMADQDPSGLVRLFLASALQRLPYDQRWPIAEALSRHAVEAEDPSLPTAHLPPASQAGEGGAALPLMIWYGIEPAVPANPRRAVALAEGSRIPLLRRYVTRRLTEEIETHPGGVNSLVGLLDKHDDVGLRTDILQGMSAGLRGRRHAPMPDDWPRIADRLTQQGRGDGDATIEKLVRELSVVFGDGRALDELRSIAADGRADSKNRRDAVRVLIENRPKGLVPLLQKLVRDRAVAAEAVRGLAAYNNEQTPRVILNNYDRLDPAGQQNAIATLTSRPEYARELLAAVGQGRIDRRDISAFHARQIRSFGNERLTAELRRLWGEIRETGTEKKQRIAELKSALTEDRLQESDLANGRQVFEKNCANCHALYGEGGDIGPDLTGSNRQNLDYLLENIVDPSATMIEDFKVSAVVLKDGRVITGVVLKQTERTLVVQTEKEKVVLDRQEVNEVVPQDVSLMPDGLLKPLTAEQIRDLIAYLSGGQTTRETKPRSLSGRQR